MDIARIVLECLPSKTVFSFLKKEAALITRTKAPGIMLEGGDLCFILSPVMQICQTPLKEGDSGPTVKNYMILL